MDERAHAIVAHRQQHGAEALAPRDLARDARQRPARAQALRAPQVRRQVAVAELEPGRLAEPAEGTEAGERLAGKPPAPLRIGAAGERVEDRVQIGRDVEPEELLVVPGVADDDEAPGISA